MSESNVITLWQAVTPNTVTAIERAHGQRLQPSSDGDPFTLLKLNPRWAVRVGETVWAQRFGTAALVEIVLPTAALATYPVESVAYADHREYRIPSIDLPCLSQALVRPVRVIGQVGCKARAVPRWARVG